MRRQSTGVLWIVGLAGLLTGQAIAQTQVQITPSKDNTLYESINGDTSNGAGQYFFTGRTNGGSRRRALLAFDIAAHVPGGATIQSATLTLHMSRTTSTIQVVQLRRILGNWGESTSDAGGNEGGGGQAQPGDATWLHRFFDTDLWAIPGGDISGVVTANQLVDGLGDYTWGSTDQMVADVQSWLDSPAQNFGWIVLSNEFQNGTAKRYDSRENSAGNPPLLTVTFEVPPPTTTSTTTSTTSTTSTTTTTTSSTTSSTSSTSTSTSSTTSTTSTTTSTTTTLVNQVQFGPLKDSTLYESETGSISNGTGQHLFAGRTNSGVRRRALLAFDVAGRVPDGATIVSVTLTLHMSRTNSSIQQLQLRRVLAGWGESDSDAPGNEGTGAAARPGDATWRHTFFDDVFWVSRGGDMSATVSATQPVGGVGSYTWASTVEMLKDAQDWLDRPERNFGWMLIGDETQPGTAKRFDSRQHPEDTSPLLTLSYTVGPDDKVPSPPDPDDDGVPGTTEDEGPNDGDGNNDGIADSLQENVASLPDVVRGRFATLQTPRGTKLVNVTAMENPSPQDMPPETEFPMGFFDFSVEGVETGQSTTVTFFGDTGEPVNTYWKYGATLQNPSPHWYEFLYDGSTGARILNDRIVLHFVDGQRGDDDLIADGRISDPGAPAFSIPPTVPVLSGFEAVESVLGHSSSRHENGFVGVAVLNPNRFPTQVSITGKNSSGAQLSNRRLQDTLPSKGQRAFLASEVVDTLADAAFLIPQGREGPIQSFFLIGDNSRTQLDGLAGEFEASRRFFFPIARHSHDERTHLFLFNPRTDRGAEVTLSLFDPVGQQLGEVSLIVPAGGSVNSTVGELFSPLRGQDNAPGPDLVLSDGYVRVTADIAVVGFQFQVTDRHLSGLAGQTVKPTTRLLAPHSFIDRTGLTELRLLNSEIVPVSVNVGLFDNGGSLLGSTQIQIGPGELMIANVADLLRLEPNG